VEDLAVLDRALQRFLGGDGHLGLLCPSISLVNCRSKPA
jgi:hypothetical protein